MGERILEVQQGAQAVEPVREDLSAGLYPSLEWGAGQCEVSLNAVFQNAQLQALHAIQWYQVNRKPQKRWARTLRCGALVLAGIAGILPIVSQILLPDGGLSPAWASVALALAAALIGFDRFFGCSSSWLRYSVTDTRLQALLRAFQLDWQIANEARQAASTHPHKDLVVRMLKRARAFEMDVQTLIQQETESWRQEFQSVLTQSDTTTRTARPSLLEGEPSPRSDVVVTAKERGRHAVQHPLPPSGPRTPAPPGAPETQQPSAPVSRAPDIRSDTGDIGTPPLSH
ncbi:SLATT domain-containing protein [Vitiosangium sp. GDMCC 1.1324]|uniref:SLATT domain-containing protein n=1 Tax=Vitiosangium sp. (strain GDMCC 1.1324) TaxID=2138576 RepID=UPI000D3B1E18|nr:SLATT domain-containing protein [Vitiosangium sp. GDMCC 1.1324]PTL76367.1 hypothetical protein DAT35_49425 [Vitiosangium sp. GDMCC 1.1324]